MVLRNAASLCFAGQFMTQPTRVHPETGTSSVSLLVNFHSLEPIACPCGFAKRAFLDRADVPYSLHVTEISENALPHYHKTMTETYYILECDGDGYLELDDKKVPVVPGIACLIPPGVVHRAVGKMKVLIVASPKFDSLDEFVSESVSQKNWR